MTAASLNLIAPCSLYSDIILKSIVLDFRARKHQVKHILLLFPKNA